MTAVARIRLAILALGTLAASPASADDVVTVGSPADARAQTRLTGRVVDYTGRELRLALPGGGERSIPAAQVVKIDTHTTRDHLLADERFAQRHFEQALAHYSRARNEEQRPWVRRQITAQIVWCHQAADQTVAAGEEFLLLVRSDPETPHFACIPLAWLPSLPSPDLDQAARRWLQRGDLPAAVLLGASHLMSTARPQALEQLNRLAASPDTRIAQLAIAQGWRAATVTAGQHEVAGWASAIEQMPEELRGGPYWVLGSALLRQQQWERAALVLLRVPILYPHQQALVARSLLDAGGALEKLDRPEQAARLYQELVAMDGVESRGASVESQKTEARGRLEALSGKAGR